MDNNYYMNIEYEFDTKVKGLRGKFVGHQTVYHKYGIDKEKLTFITNGIKKYLNEDNCMVTLSIDNLDWYGAPHSVYRIIKEWNGELSVVNFMEQNPHKEPLNSRDIRKMVSLFAEILDEEVKNNMES